MVQSCQGDLTLYLGYSFPDYVLFEERGVALFKDIDKIFNLFKIVSDKLTAELKKKTINDYEEIEKKVNNIYITVDELKEPILINIDISILGLSSIPIVKNGILKFHIVNIASSDLLFIDDFKNNSNDKTTIGEYSYDENDVFSFGVINKENNFIEIGMYACNGQLNRFSFFGTVLHEFNHFFQDYKERIQWGDSDSIKYKDIKYRSAFYEELEIYLRKEAKSKQELTANLFLYDIFYFLFDDSELNAFIANIFGDLVGGNVSIKNLNNYKKNSRTFEYLEDLNKKLKNNYLDYISDNTWLKLAELIGKYGYKKHNFLPFSINKNINLLKHKIERLAETKVKKYYRKVQQVIDTFYTDFYNKIYEDIFILK